MLGIYLSCESNQGLRRLIGHVRSQFDFHESVFAVTQANDGIDFQTVFIQEMVQRRQLTWLKENSTCFSFSLRALKDQFAKTAKNFSAIWPDFIHPFGQKYSAIWLNQAPFLSCLSIPILKISPERIF